MKKLFVLLILPFLSCTAPKSLTAKPHSFPNPFNTKSQPINYQTKKTYLLAGVSVSNEFPAARLNDFHQEEDSVFVATISPENIPINPSPWYAFKIWSENKQDIYLKLSYTNNHKHRYHPKLSKDGESWTAMDTTLLRFNPDSTQISFKFPISQDTTWVAAQEIQDYKRVTDWVLKFEQNQYVTRDTAGVSAQGRTLHYLNISKGAYDRKPTIIVLSRQHPPEVTGYFAMQSFLETLLDEGEKMVF